MNFRITLLPLFFKFYSHLFFLVAVCVINNLAMERPPKVARTAQEEETRSYPPSPMPQERVSYPISPSPSEASVTGSWKRKQPTPVRAIKKTRPNESYTITYYLQNNPDLIASRMHGKTLDLSGLKIDSLDGLLAIPGIKTIFNIILTHNLITQIKRTDFAGLSQLNTLDLSNNDIELLETDGFAELASLINLFLNNNRITRIEHDTFANLNNLKKLSLSHNRLTALHQKMFAGIPHLEELHLNDNAIADIEKHALADIPFLTRLKLNKNQLTKLTGPMFEGTKYKREQIGGRDILKNLQELDLRDNKLTEIPTNILAYLPELQRLLLTNNQIAQVSAPNISALKKASKLKTIDLVNNRLSDATLKKLKAALPNLEIIATVSMEITEAAEKIETFSAAKSLSDIEPRYQEQEAEEAAIQNLISLNKTLRDYIRDEDYSFWRHLIRGTYQQWYELDNLNLTTLDGLQEVPDIKTVFRIYLNHNLLQYIPANTFAGLSELQDIDLTSNQITSFDPQAFAGIPQLRSLNISNNGLKQLRPEMMSQLKNLEGLVLETNGMESLPPYIFKDLKKLRHLFIDHNKLKQITAEHLEGLENLEALMLNNNQIYYIDSEILKPLKKLTLLTLGNNPLSKENVEAIKKALPGVTVHF